MYHNLKQEQKNKSCIKNGRKGGRPRQDSGIYLKIPGINLVILTPKQYDMLIDRYGYHLLDRALLIFDKWLKYGGEASKKYVGKNNYAHFRSDGWVINEALRQLRTDTAR